MTLCTYQGLSATAAQRTMMRFIRMDCRAAHLCSGGKLASQRTACYSESAFKCLRLSLLLTACRLQRSLCSPANPDLASWPASVPRWAAASGGPWWRAQGGGGNISLVQELQAENDKLEAENGSIAKTCRPLPACLSLCHARLRPGDERFRQRNEEQHRILR